MAGRASQLKLLGFKRISSRLVNQKIETVWSFFWNVSRFCSVRCSTPKSFEKNRKKLVNFARSWKGNIFSNKQKTRVVLSNIRSSKNTHLATFWGPACNFNARISPSLNTRWQFCRSGLGQISSLAFLAAQFSFIDEKINNFRACVVHLTGKLTQAQNEAEHLLKWSFFSLT